MDSPKRVIIAGPTGIGKTAVSLELAKAGRYAIISADSRQCYRHLDIGTGKVTPAEMGDIPHYNVSNLDLSEPDTAAKFVARSKIWESEIHQTGKVPLYVGGSTLHLQSVVWPLDEAPQACVQNLVQLRNQELAEGKDFMIDWLERVDPLYATKVDGYNSHRVYRALDVYLQTGKPFSSFHTEGGFDEVPSETVLLVLECARTQLVDRIEKRVNAMISAGIVEETKKVLEMGCSGREQALQTVGYKEVLAYLRNEIDVETMREKIIISTRRYAKRQVTWFKRWKGAHFVEVPDLDTQQITQRLINEYKLPF